MQSNSQSGRLDGRVALVSGGASGIGAACAARLAEEGASVLITDVQDEKIAVIFQIIAQPVGSSSSCR